MKKIFCTQIAFLKKHKVIIAILILAIVLRMIWLKLTLTGDEGEAGYDAMLWLRGELPYAERLSEKPPLLYLIYAVFIALFGNTILPVRIFNSVLFFLSVASFYLLVNNWYGRNTALFATLVYVFFLNAPAFWGPYAVAIHLSMPFTIFSVLLCNKYIEKGETVFLILSGIFLSIAGLVRLNSFIIGFVLLAILTLSVWENSTKSLERFLAELGKKILILLVGVLIPLLYVVSYFWVTGTFDKLFYNVLIRPIFVASPRLRSWNPPFGWQFLGLVEGLPILVFAILGYLSCFFILKRQNIYVMTWLLAPLFLLYALEQRDPPHFSTIAPAASILSAIALSLSLEGFRPIKRANNSLTVDTHRIKGVFILTIFILSLLVSIYFQAQQFPSGTIHWEFINWDYSMVGNYDKVIELTTYLKSLSIKDGELLVQYWLPYVYWLTGVKAPSIHLDTYSRGRGIPLEEYERLFTEVRERKIPYVIVISKIPKGADPITDFVRENYFPLKSIGGVDIYSASYPVEKGVYYSFIANLGEAQAYGLLPNGSRKPLSEISDVVKPRIDRLTVNNVTKNAICQHPLVRYSNITFPNVKIQQHSILEFSIAIDPRVWLQGGDGVLFEIIIQFNEKTQKIFSKYIDPKNNVEDRKWFDYKISLKEYEDKVITISFITNPGPLNDSNWDWAYWGDPLIRILK